jgi:hypothetical protein
MTCPNLRDAMAQRNFREVISKDIQAGLVTFIASFHLLFLVPYFRNVNLSKATNLEVVKLTMTILALLTLYVGRLER